MPHVGIQRLAAGDDQDDRPEDEDPAEAVAEEELRAPPGRKRGEDLRFLNDLTQAENGERGEPDEHHRPEQPADVARAAGLDREQSHEDQAGDGDDKTGECGAGDRQPLHGRQDRDRRRDHAVTVEERRADDCQERHARHAADAVGGVPIAFWDEGQQRQDAPFPVVVGPHHEDDILHRDHEHERPKHERENAEQVGSVDRSAVRGGDMKAFLERVERARADVTEDDAERQERQTQEVGRAGWLARSRPVTLLHSRTLLGQKDRTVNGTSATGWRSRQACGGASSWPAATRRCSSRG